METLVTGATGYLGGHVARLLVEAGHTVRALVRPGRDATWLAELGVALHVGDLTDERSLHNALRGADGLVHCAARMGYWSRQNEEQRRINVEGSSALYRAAGKRGIARVVHVSTVGAVGARRSPTPMNENEPWAGQGRPRAMYFTSKREAEERALAAAKGGLELCVVNPGGMHGARADGEPAGGMVAAVLAGKVGRVPPGGGTMARADDVARGCLAALERGERGRRYLLGGHNRTWLAIHESIASL
ncbi:MAG: NAD-dependent epimerase/dehydratase family protein, partial [Planctomycetota bacterium]|nr:NAD-dependent epimerase/dehydratase family protein [Planctomycetota bacterium]